MAEATSRYFSSKRQQSLARTGALLDKHWPNGIAGAISDYAAGRATWKRFEDACHLHFRAVRNFFESRGVKIHDTHTAIVNARKLNPEWNENISRAKVRKPYYHSPETVKTISEKRAATFREHPERHGNASVGMTSREAEFAKVATELGIRVEFNKNVPPFWLDFYMPDLGLGFEIQHSSRLPSKTRADFIRDALSLKALLYVPNIYFFNGNIEYIRSLVWSVQRDPDSLGPTVGDAVWLCQKQARVDARWYGFGFMRKWSETQKVFQPNNPNPVPAAAPSVGSL